ncbi:FtsW/RodA/SpoVE family cell cycle protein [Euzebya pacifica]|uniref:FtsW/RodA/SpoVE family cell cycle protein n=1 Tax=Euzebya pacifica TaxID=1608957 RepID=UPI0013E0066E|nr:FtsW/RodA/SpoVE family cell cycle protein [Euzebya pacifica]
MSVSLDQLRGTPEVRRRANTEVGLLVLAIIITLSAYTLVGLAQEPVIPAGLLAYGGALAALAAAAHLVSRRLAPGADPLLLPIAFLLNGIGLVMIRRVDFAEASRDSGLELAPLQTIWTIVGVALFAGTLLLLRDHTVLDRYRYIIGLAAVVALMTPLLPVLGTDFGRGSRIWVRIPGGFSLQPGEFAKIGLVIFFAAYLAEKRALLSAATSRLGPLHVPPARAFGPVALAWFVSLGVLVFERDLGLSLLIFGIFVAMLYMATGRLAYVVFGGALFGAGALASWSVFSHVQTRVSIWLDPFADAQGSGFQLVQSLFAFGTGGVAGVGWGQGNPELIPDVETDFIFSAIGEELGLLGTTAVLLLYFLLAGRGFVTALRAPDDFSKLLAAGLTFVFSLQVFVIVGGVSRLIPLTGITLPLVSYGGSSLLANYVLIALLVRVSAARAPVARRSARADLARIDG